MRGFGAWRIELKKKLNGRPPKSIIFHLYCMLSFAYGLTLYRYLRNAALHHGLHMALTN